MAATSPARQADPSRSWLTVRDFPCRVVARVRKRSRHVGRAQVSSSDGIAVATSQAGPSTTGSMRQATTRPTAAERAIATFAPDTSPLGSRATTPPGWSLAIRARLTRPYRAFATSRDLAVRFESQRQVEPGHAASSEGEPAPSRAFATSEHHPHRARPSRQAKPVPSPAGWHRPIGLVPVRAVLVGRTRDLVGPVVRLVVRRRARAMRRCSRGRIPVEHARRAGRSAPGHPHPGLVVDRDRDPAHRITRRAGRPDRRRRRHSRLRAARRSRWWAAAACW